MWTWGMKFNTKVDKKGIKWRENGLILGAVKFYEIHSGGFHSICSKPEKMFMDETIIFLK